MQEIELKFLVPEARLKGLLRQVKVKASQTTQLAAHYYDTPNCALANAGIGLRIRKEGDDWVQTIKAGSDGIAARLEHNALLDTERVQVMLDEDKLLPDLTLYQETSSQQKTPIAPALADFKLTKLAKKLTRHYVTDVQRTTRLLRDNANNRQKNNGGHSGAKNDNMIEIAYDFGQIIHGSDETQSQPIQEIEFELVSGELEFLFTTAKVWCKRYKLCLSTVTKAERGGLLIKGEEFSPAIGADLSLLKVDKNSSMPDFIRAVVHNCLLQILPNSSAIVAGSVNNEHILQLRIGIRRLGTALKAFKNFSEHLNPEWLAILKQTERLLGDYRDLANLASHVEPKLEQQGAPSVDWTADIEAIKITPINAIRANDFQITLLELIEFTMSVASDEPQVDKLAINKSANILSKARSKLIEAIDHLDTVFEDNLDSVESDNSELKASKADDLDQENLHTRALDKVRDQIETLLAISEFAAPLYDNKKSKRLIKPLTKAQRALGQYHDHQYYQQRYQHKAAIDSNALYGAGWFAALQKDDLQRCQKRLAKVPDSAKFW